MTTPTVAATTPAARAAIPPPDWRAILTRLPLAALAGVLYAAGVALFLAPANIAPGGVVGIGVILNHLSGVSIGVVYLLGNIVLLTLGYRFLGGWTTVLLTLGFVLVFSVLEPVFAARVPAGGLTDERLLNALYAGIVGGVASGLMYRLGGTPGGSTIISRVLANRLSIPLSSAYLYVDTAVILAAGLVFGFEGALLAMLALYIDGSVADYVLEGPSLVRTAFIVTTAPEAVTDAIFQNLPRGVTAWEGRGMYTGAERTVLFVTVARSQVAVLRQVVAEADPSAFLVVGQGHVAYGEGFRPMKPPRGRG